MIVAVSLAPAFDRTLQVERLIPGTVHRPTIVTHTAGGKGANVARAATILGHHAVLVAIVGEPAYSIALNAERIAHRLVPGEAALRWCTSVADAESHTMTDFYEPATPITTTEWEQLQAAVEATLTEPQGWLAITGTWPIGVPRHGLDNLVHAAHARRWKVAVDTSGAGLEHAIAAAPDVIKVNHHEAAGVLGPGTPHQLAAGLQRHCTTAIITVGTDGAYTADAHARCTTRGDYPVGSGDAFLAGLLAAFDGGADLHAALQLATGAAAANAMQPGAGRLDPAVARAIAAGVTVTVSPSNH